MCFAIVFLMFLFQSWRGEKRTEVNPGSWTEWKSFTKVTMLVFFFYSQVFIFRESKKHVDFKIYLVWLYKWKRSFSGKETNEKLPYVFIVHPSILYFGPGQFEVSSWKLFIWFSKVAQRQVQVQPRLLPVGARWWCCTIPYLSLNKTETQKTY